jgi:hypothetical protein
MCILRDPREAAVITATTVLIGDIVSAREIDEVLIDAPVTVIIKVITALRGELAGAEGAVIAG